MLYQAIFEIRDVRKYFQYVLRNEGPGVWSVYVGRETQSHLSFREMPMASNPKAPPVGGIVLHTMVGVGYISGHLLLQTVSGDGLQLQGLSSSEVIYPPDTVYKTMFLHPAAD